jgi:hypothetical protein
VSELERRVTFNAAWDRRDPDPKKNYGIHTVELRMLLVGPKGATQFVLYTGWHWIDSPNVRDLYPMPSDLGYHSSTPQWEGQEPFDCDVLPEGRCYYDGSGLNAQRVYERLLREGSDGVWAELENYYRELFEETADV